LKVLGEFEARLFGGFIGQVARSHRWTVHPASVVKDIVKELNKPITPPKAMANEGSFSFPLGSLMAVTAGGGLVSGIRDKSLREAFRSPYIHLVTRSGNFILLPAITGDPSKIFDGPYSLMTSRWQPKAIEFLRMVALGNNLLH
jgi:hypothetical protein